MKLAELKSFLETLTPEQLEQQAVTFRGDGEEGAEIDHWHISEEDCFWERHGDCLGTLENAKESLGEDWEDEKDDLIIVPKGSISFYTL